MISHIELKELFEYRPETGEFICLTQRAKRSRVGSVAGSLDRSTGYHRIRIGAHTYSTHRLAWLYVTGEWPQHELDHINGERADNRWQNLREATHQQNAFNRKLRSDNSSGHRRVRWNKQCGKWQAFCTRAGKHTHLGLFATLEEAVAARDAAEAELAHREFLRA
jgi:AP2 domain.